MKVLVIVARGLQIGALGCYGNARVRTPWVDELAAGGIVFDQHFADRADAEGARRAWRSGRYHFPLLNEPATPEALPDNDLVRLLRQHAIHTRLIVDASRPAPGDFEADWDEVHRVVPEEDTSGLEATLAIVERSLKELVPRDNWLLWVDLGTMIPPWEVPDEFAEPYFSPEIPDEQEGEGIEEMEEMEEPPEPREPLWAPAVGVIDPDDDDLFLRLHCSYAAAATYLDAGVGQVVEWLREYGEEVVLLLTTDWGQALGEHGLVGPVRPWLHDEIIHLPLVLLLPEGQQAGRRVSALTQAVDLAPTLADLFGLKLAESHGHSLLPLARGEVEAVRPYTCAGSQIGDAIEWALRTPEWSFLLPVQGPPEEERAPQLYVKPDDRWEVNNVAHHHFETLDHLEKALRGFMAATAREGPLEVPPLGDAEQPAATGPTGRE
jgi:arylsulfatase A-like enzyme